MRDVYWIRHAQSTANAGERTDNASEIVLTQLGVEQARLLAAQFPVRPGLIVTSPYMRTLLTAKPLMARFESVPHEIWPVHELTFLTRGDAKNTTVLERRGLAGPYWTAMDPYLELGDGGESFSTFYRRVLASLTRAAAYRGVGPLVIFTHTRVLALLVQLVVLPPVDVQEAMGRLYSMAVAGHWEFANAGILRMGVCEDGSIQIGAMKV